jgi:magnesium transporter
MADHLSASSPSTELENNGPEAPRAVSAGQTGSCQLVLTTYNSDESSEQRTVQLQDLEEAILEARRQDRIIWLDTIGTPEQKTIDQIRELFQFRNFDPFELVKAHQRSKFEMYEDQMAIVVWSVEINNALHPHQIVMMLGEKCLLSFQFDGRDLLEDVKQALKKGLNKSRRGGADYLAYTIVNQAVDSYFPYLERYGERLETVEEQILENPTRRSISQIHAIKRDLLNVRRHLWSLRETINTTIRDNSDAFADGTKIHFRDTYEHVVQLIDVVEIYRELCSDLMDVYLSSISNRMNEVMKVLTVITTVFVPPALIASIYGMNFHSEKSPFNMPELSWYYGYPLALGLMLVTALTTLIFFWIKGWLGDGPRVIRMLRHKLHHKKKL